MSQIFKFYLLSFASVLVLQGCSNATSTYQQQLKAERARVKQLETELASSRPEQVQANDSAQNVEGMPVGFDSNGGAMLPSYAKPGECYARVWVDPIYATKSKRILVQPESNKIATLDAKYEWVEESVMIQPEEQKLIEVPAEYRTVSEEIMVSPAIKEWKTQVENGRPVSDDVLAAAAKGGIKLDSSNIGECFHEHYKPAIVRETVKQVEVSPKSFEIKTIPAKYQWVEKKILVKEASTRIIDHPAKFEEFTEQVVDKPAHRMWKKGSGPIQKIDAATGEIMCLVDVPETYKTVTRNKLVKEAYTETIEIPAEYETIKVRELVSPAREERIEIAAGIETVTGTEISKKAEFVWHEVTDNTMSPKTRTGNTICLTEEKAEYKTVERQFLVKPASTRTEIIPAVYETRKVHKLVTPASEIATKVPAVYETVSYQELEKAGHMDWRSILCETNITKDLVLDLQNTLNKKGYNAGKADGVIGWRTIRAINKYQEDHDLPVDKHLNMKTISSLGLR